MSEIVIGARTGSPGRDEGQYGVFYNAVPDGSVSTGTAWIYGLQQNATNRSNLALVNTGEVDEGDSLFSLDIYDGETGRLVKDGDDQGHPAPGLASDQRHSGRLRPRNPAGICPDPEALGQQPLPGLRGHQRRRGSWRAQRRRRLPAQPVAVLFIGERSRRSQAGPTIPFADTTGCVDSILSPRLLPAGLFEAAIRNPKQLQSRNSCNGFQRWPGAGRPSLGTTTTNRKKSPYVPCP